MTVADTNLKVLQEALIILRNMEIQTQGYQNVGVKYAETYAETLQVMARMASQLHGMCQSAIVGHAIAVCTEAGYEVKSPQ